MTVAKLIQLLSFLPPDGHVKVLRFYDGENVGEDVERVTSESWPQGDGSVLTNVTLHWTSWPVKE